MWNAREITDKELDEAFSLRYKTFAEKLQWIPANERKLDVDKYDLDARHVGVYRDNELAATCRFIEHGKPWMLTEVFPYLQCPVHPNSVELSRLSISDSIDLRLRVMAFGLLVYKTSQLIPQWFTYVVTTEERATVYYRYGIMFDALAWHKTAHEVLVVLRIDMKRTNWKEIAEKSLTEEYHG